MPHSYFPFPSLYFETSRQYIVFVTVLGMPSIHHDHYAFISDRKLVSLAFACIPHGKQRIVVVGMVFLDKRPSRTSCIYSRLSKAVSQLPQSPPETNTYQHTLHHLRNRACPGPASITMITSFHTNTPFQFKIPCCTRMLALVFHLRVSSSMFDTTPKLKRKRF